MCFLEDFFDDVIYINIWYFFLNNFINYHKNCGKYKITRGCNEIEAGLFKRHVSIIFFKIKTAFKLEGGPLIYCKEYKQMFHSLKIHTNFFIFHC